jgi:hypothetical protein
MGEHVVSIDLGVRWNPNIEHGVLAVSELGDARLRLRARVDDPDQRNVMLSWHGCKAARMEPPNDEAISGHRLYSLGLHEVSWVGEVLDSSLIADLEQRNSVHPRHQPDRFRDLHHWIVRLKGRVVEVVARSIEASREVPRSTGA